MKKKSNKNKKSKNTEHSGKKRFTKLSELIIEKNTAISPDTSIKEQDYQSVPLGNLNIPIDKKLNSVAETNAINTVAGRTPKLKIPSDPKKVDNQKQKRKNLDKQPLSETGKLTAKTLKKVSLKKEKTATPKYRTYLNYDKISLPASYGENKLVLIMRDTKKIFAYWDILHTKSEKKETLIYITIYKSNDKSLNAKTGIQHYRTVKPAVAGSMYLETDPLYRYYYGEITIQRALRSKLLSTSNTVSIPIPEKKITPASEWKTMESLFRQMRQTINKALPDKKALPPLQPVREPEQVPTAQKTTEISAPVIQKQKPVPAYHLNNAFRFKEKQISAKSQQDIKQTAKYIEKISSEFERKITKFTGELRSGFETKPKITNWNSLFKKFLPKNQKDKIWEKIRRTERFYPKYFRK